MYINIQTHKYLNKNIKSVVRCDKHKLQNKQVTRCEWKRKREKKEARDDDGNNDELSCMRGRK